MTIYKSRGELLVAAGKSILMQEEAGIEPTGKHHGILVKIRTYKFDDLAGWEFPLCVVEGKEVFVGDALYDAYNRQVLAEVADDDGNLKTDSRWYSISSYSWNPPKPKTVMVELMVEDAKCLANPTWVTDDILRLANACNKALGELK